MELAGYWYEERADDKHIRVSLRNHRLDGNTITANYVIAYYVGFYSRKERRWVLQRERMMSDDAERRSKSVVKISSRSIIQFKG